MKVFTNDEKRLLNFVRHIAKNYDCECNERCRMSCRCCQALDMIDEVLKEDAADFIVGRKFLEVEYEPKGISRENEFVEPMVDVRQGS